MISVMTAVQDFFDLKAIPSDTDYRMYSYRNGYGNLPGIDVATILDAEAYHTNRDASHRIQPGSLQVRLLEQQVSCCNKMEAVMLFESSEGPGDCQATMNASMGRLPLSLQDW